ncbi:kinase-like domain-containing protein, partial [Mycena vulgaris]
RRHAHQLLTKLSDVLITLPHDLIIHGVVLLSDRPVKYGGFADIYHGKKTNSEGKEDEVALKVLKIFQNTSYDTRRLLIQKFAKEALVWHYLKHPNILPFLRVDETTFPIPAMAMVSYWMYQGSVLNYIGENSPVSPYGISLLHDVIRGLMYLHSENIVHGDLCGRNILIDEERACLADFGLAAFIESETSIKTSARAGSTRWMAPELLLPNVYQPGLPFRRTPASDVWAFGCVCCEVWTEGVIPFADMSDGGILVALSGVDPKIVPYKTQPCDKSGTPMPQRLWKLVQECFRHNAAVRPTTELIEPTLSAL